MTVAELIADLQKLPPDMPVLAYAYSGSGGNEDKDEYDIPSVLIWQYRTDLPLHCVPIELQDRFVIGQKIAIITG